MGVIVLFLSFFVFIFVGSPIALALGGSALIYICLLYTSFPWGLGRTQGAPAKSKILWGKEERRNE